MLEVPLADAVCLWGHSTGLWCPPVQSHHDSKFVSVQYVEMHVKFCQVRSALCPVMAVCLPSLLWLETELSAPVAEPVIPM